MPTLQEDLYSALQADSTVTGLLGSRTYWESIPNAQPIQLPWAFLAIPEQEPTSGNATRQTDHSTVAIEIFALDVATLTACETAIRNCLHGFSGGQILRCLYQGRSSQQSNDGYVSVQNYSVHSAPNVTLPTGGSGLPTVELHTDGLYVGGVKLAAGGTGDLSSYALKATSYAPTTGNASTPFTAHTLAGLSDNSEIPLYYVHGFQDSQQPNHASNRVYSQGWFRSTSGLQGPLSAWVAHEPAYWVGTGSSQLYWGEYHSPEVVARDGTHVRLHSTTWSYGDTGYTGGLAGSVYNCRVNQVYFLRPSDGSSTISLYPEAGALNVNNVFQVTAGGSVVITPTGAGQTISIGGYGGIYTDFGPFTWYAPAYGSSVDTPYPLNAPKLTLTATSPSVVPLTVQGATGQTADLTRWQDGTGSTVAKITPGGLVDGTTLRVTGASMPSAGAGVEVAYSGGNGYVQCYDRTAATYQPLYINASAITFGSQITTPAGPNYLGSVRISGAGSNTIWQSSSGTALSITTNGGNVSIGAGISAKHFEATSDDKVGFFGATPVTRPSLPAAGTVTADDIRAALISLGLCS